MRYGDVFIEAVAYELPSEAMSTAAIEQQLVPLYRRMGVSPGWLEVLTGIKERRLWPAEERPWQAAARAASRALQQAGVAGSEVEVLINTSVCRDQLEPSVACLVHGELGLSRRCQNYDIGNACLGFLSGMVNVANMIQLGQIDCGLVVAGEGSRQVLENTLATLSAPKADIEYFKAHLATLTLGSAAMAMVLTSRKRARQPHRFLGGVSLAASEFNDLCRGDLGGMVTDSVRLLREGVRLAAETWQASRRLLGWGHGRIAAYALHQVGRAHHSQILKSLAVPPERAPAIYPWMGNVGACGVPLTMALAVEQGLVGPGQDIALMGIGSGLNCSMMGVRW